MRCCPSSACRQCRSAASATPGFGRFHGAAGLREFTYAKSVVRKRFNIPGPDMQSFPRTPDQYKAVRDMIRMRYERKFR